MVPQGNCRDIGHKAAAEMLGITPLELSELRGKKEFPAPDVVVVGQPPRWKYETVAKYKRNRDRQKLKEKSACPQP